jgi:hypothetical protein
MFDEKFICYSEPAGERLTCLVGAAIVLDQNDFPAIKIAAHNLAEDFARVTKGAPSPVHFLSGENGSFTNEASTAIIVGSIERNPTLQRLEKDGKLDFSKIKGKWESYTTAVVDDPFEGCSRALVIAGSDKRGVVFGIYSLSEQIGVSPYRNL